MIDDQQPNDQNATPAPSRGHHLRAALAVVGEAVKVVIISCAIIVPVRYFLIQPFYVKGASMEPNFYNHEYLIINEIVYRLAPPRRGEVVVFRPTDTPDREFFIKRVIGLPGETVSIHNGRIKVTTTGDSPESAFLDESAYLPLEVLTYGDATYQLGSDEYFVLGDNRPASLDSRRFGPIHRSQIVGRAWVRGWPLDRVTVFNQPPAYNL